MTLLIADARADLVEALGEVEDLRVYTKPATMVDPPAAVVALPDLQFETYCAGVPTSATFSIPLIVKANDKAIDALEELLLAAAAAVEALPSAVVTAARIGSWDDTLPAYDMEVEYAL